MDRNASSIVDALYPVALALANLGAGIGLYETGALALSLALWLGGLLVLVGICSSVRSRVTTSSMEPLGDWFRVRFRAETLHRVLDRQWPRSWTKD